MKKIIIERTEGIAEVIDRILNEPDKEIALVIPKGSTLGRSVSNFHLLKREADSAGRTVIVESVDETILAFAKESDLESSHPLWRGVRGVGGFSDIVSKDETRPVELREYEEPDEVEEEERPVRPTKRGQKKSAPVVETREEELANEDEKEEEESEVEARKRFFSNDPVPSSDDDDDEDGSFMSRLPEWLSGRLFIVGAAAIIALVIVLYVLSAFFNRADVTIDFKQDPWTYRANFIADKAASTINSSNNVIPAQVFSSNKNITETFTATAIQTVSQKAQGTITIYNNYSADSQELVATTRFLTPDGKIFRIVSNVVVPGAHVTNGKITPSSITAAIVADQPGPDYNVGPVAHLSIPGFANSPRADGFYGTITGATTGGFIGKRASPTTADIAAAKASTTAVLQSSLQGGFSGTYPNNFKILDGATAIQVTKLTVNTSTDQNGNFTVFGEASLQAIGFDESTLKAYLLSLAQAQDASSTFSSLKLDYTAVNANFSKGQVSFSLSADGSLEPAFSVSDFQNEIAGKSISSARDAIASLPNLADGKISVWPFWLWSIPSSLNKVHVVAN